MKIIIRNIAKKALRVVLFAFFAIILFAAICALDFLLPALLFGSEAVNQKFQLSAPAIFIWAFGTKALFSYIILEKPKPQTTIIILLWWVAVIVADTLLIWTGANPFYPEVSLQFVFLIVVAVWWLILSPLKKRKNNLPPVEIID